jgi:hypothetical protein
MRGFGKGPSPCVETSKVARGFGGDVKEDLKVGEGEEDVDDDAEGFIDAILLPSVLNFFWFQEMYLFSLAAVD